MRTGMNVHLTTRAKVAGKVVTDGIGRRYITLEITDDGVVYPAICFFPEDETFLDKLANECERVTREYIGDVPPLEPLPAELHGGPEVA
jgi:hypothetical protein